MFASNAISTTSRTTSLQPSATAAFANHGTTMSKNSPFEAMDHANDKQYTKNINQLGTSASIIPRLNDVVVAVSSGALFDFSVDHEIGKTKGPEAYAKYQIENENNVLEKGEAFNLVDKMFKINDKLKAINSNMRFDVVITSKNTPDACLRTLNSARHYKVPVSRAAFTSGVSPFDNAKAFGATLYLTTNPEDAKAAIAADVPAAHILPSKKGDEHEEQLRIAFDADAVIFSDASERISMTQGLSEFFNHERENANIPLEKGPLYPFLHQLSQIKREFSKGEAPIRIAVVTARSAPADTRLIQTLRSWGIEIDDLYLLGGKPKGPFLGSIKADIFFDDKFKNVEHSANHVVSGHVNYGVSNEDS